MNKRTITFGTVVHTVISCTLFAAVAVIVVPLLLLCAAVPARWRYDFPLLLWTQSFMYWAVVKSSLVRVRIVGAEHINDEAAIVLANHQSYLDGMFVGLLLGQHPHIWLAKKSLSYIPVVNILIRRFTVMVDKSSPQRAMRSLVRAMNLVAHTQRHLVLFPEGTRFPDDQIHTFLGGFALMARKLNRPVIPIRLFNVEKVLPAGSGWLQSHSITIVVGKPCRLRDDETEQQFINRVHRWFLDQQESL